LKLGPNKNPLRIEENDTKNSISLTNGIIKMIQSIDSSSCKCDCHRNSTTLESITNQFFKIKMMPIMKLESIIICSQILNQSQQIQSFLW
jgi:hypothetical protein